MKFKFVQNIQLLLFILALWCYPLVALFVSSRESSQSLTIPYRALVLLVSLIVIFISVRTKRDKNKQNQLSTSLVLIFWLIYSVKLIFYVNDSTFTFAYPIERYVTSWFLISLVPALAILKTDFSLEKEMKFLQYSWAINFIILTGVLIKQFAFGSFTLANSRLAFDALNSISLGNMGAYTTILAITLSFRAKTTKLLSISILLSIMLSLYFLIFANSRGPIVSLIITLILGISFKFNSIVKRIINNFNLLKIKLKYVIIASLIIFATAFVLKLAFAEGSGINVSRLTVYSDMFGDTTDLDLETGRSRQERAFMAVELIAQGFNLVTGCCLELPGVGYVHNIILDSYLATGVVGGTVFCAILLLSIVKSIKLISGRDSYWNWIGMIYIHILLMGMSSGNLYECMLFWYCTSVLIAVEAKPKVTGLTYVFPPQSKDYKFSTK